MHKTLELGGAADSLRCQLVGRGQPSVLLVHGLGDCGQAFAEVFADAGHALMIDAAPEFYTFLLDVIERLSSY